MRVGRGFVGLNHPASADRTSTASKTLDMRSTSSEVEADGEDFRVRCAVCGEIAKVATLDEGLTLSARHDCESEHDDDFGLERTV